MENRKAFIIAGICLIISIMLISAYVSVKESELTAEFGEEVTVVIATAPIREYSIIRPDMVALNTTIGQKVFKKFRQPSSAVRLNEVVGKATSVAIAEGEQVTLTKLLHQDGKPVLDRQVQQQFRAVTLLIAPHIGVGRLIRPGNRIDILAAPTFEAKGSTVWEVKTIIQNVLVLATGRSIQNEIPTRVDKTALDILEGQFAARKRKDFYGVSQNLVTSKQDDNYKTITVQLSPPDAEKILFLISQFGDSVLYFTLRNSADDKLLALNTTLLDDVLGPDSDYGRSQIKPPPITPTPPEFYDSVGGRRKPVYRR